MNLDLILFLIFIVFLIIFYYTRREKFELQGKIIAIYRTSIGLKLMDKFSKIPKPIRNILSVTSIILGFLGMIAIFYILIRGTYSLLFIPKSQPVLAPVLPGVKIAGLPTLSFLHWIIGILFVAIIHEFSHGLFSRFHNIKIKSSGFAFFGPVLAAFVEPDEKQLAKKSKYAQLSVFSAGPFSNIVTGLIIFLISVLLIAPATSSLFEQKGVQVVSLEDGFPAAASGLQTSDQITAIDSMEIKNIEDFTKVMSTKKPNDIIDIKTQNSNYRIKLAANPDNATKAYLGIQVTSHDVGVKESAVAKFGKTWPWIFYWISELFFWLWVISLGVALFNLLPLGPVDGGRMFSVFLLTLIKDKKKANKVFIGMTIFILLLILINLAPYLIKLLKFLFSTIVSLAI